MKVSVSKISCVINAMIDFEKLKIHEAHIYFWLHTNISIELD